MLDLENLKIKAQVQCPNIKNLSNYHADSLVDISLFFLVKMKLSISKEPFQPSISYLQEKIKKYPPNYLHDSWKDFLYWDTELEP